MVGKMEPSFPHIGLPRKSPAGGLVTGYMWNEAMEEIDEALGSPGVPEASRPFTPGTTVGELRIDAYSKILFAWDGVSWVAESLSTVIDVTYYIDPTGDDDAIGDLANPLATPQEAFDRMPGLILHEVIFDMAAGSYPAFVIKPMQVRFSGKLRVLGKSRLAQGLVGPNTGTATGGDEYSLTMTGAGWAPDELKYKFWRYISGDHYDSEYRMTGAIISNTADNFIQQGVGWDTPSIDDVFEIRENTVEIGAVGTVSVRAHNCGGGEIYFEPEDISDENPGRIGINFENIRFTKSFIPVGRVGLSFSYCDMPTGISPSDSWASGLMIFDNSIIAGTSGPIMRIDASMIVLLNNSYCARAWLSDTGRIESYVSTHAGLSSCIQLYKQSSAKCDNCVVGQAGSRSVVFDFGWNGHFEAADSIFEKSTSSGIGSVETGLQQSDGGSIYLMFCNLRENARSGVFLQGGTVTAYACESTVANTRFGVEVRTGGILLDRGGNTITGTIGDVSVDGAAAVAWAGLPVAGLEANYAGGI